MKIKQSILLILVGILMIPVSCTDNLLDQINTNAVSTGNFWSNAADAELAVNGMYHPITNTFFWGRIIHTGAILRSDVFNIRPFGTNTSMSTFQGEPGVARWATEVFQEPYKTVFRANAIMENVNAENVPNQAQRDGFIGQAYFMRAFSYFYLVNLFGNVPLVTTTAQGAEDFFPTQASPEDVWTQIIADFTMAESLLPSSWSGADAGRATSGAATGMRGKSELYAGRWAEAEASLRRVVNSGTYSLLPAEQYGDNFGVTNENNSESLFELQYLGLESFAWGVDIPGVGTLGTYHIDYAPPLKSPDQSHYVNSWVRDVFEENGDIVRRNETIVFDFPGATGFAGQPFTEDFAGEISLANTEGMEAIYSVKYAGFDIGDRASVDVLGTNVGNNWRILRYSDVLLMLAEAINNQGRPGDAETFLNEVRSRAQIEPKTGLSQAEMGQAIIDERVMELTGEGHRFFDLVRWDLADDYIGANSLHGQHPKSLSGGVFQSGKHELVWIPQSELSSNPNLVQNPGY